MQPLVQPTKRSSACIGAAARLQIRLAVPQRPLRLATNLLAECPQCEGTVELVPVGRCCYNVMLKRDKLYKAVGVVVGIAFNALAMIDFSVGDTATALHELLSCLLNWTASGVLDYLERQEHDQAGAPGGECQKTDQACRAHDADDQ